MKRIIYLNMLIFILLLLNCDWYCKKDHIFTFSYPNELSQSEFNFELDYSEVPEYEIWVMAEYFLYITNCSEKDELTIEIYTQFSLENEYHLDEMYKFLPGESNMYKGSLLYRETTGEFLDEYKERKVSILLKGLGSSCFNGEINIQTVFVHGGLGKPTCPYGYEVD